MSKVRWLSREGKAKIEALALAKLDVEGLRKIIKRSRTAVVNYVWRYKSGVERNPGGRPRNCQRGPFAFCPASPETEHNVLEVVGRN